METSAENGLSAKQQSLGRRNGAVGPGNKGKERALLLSPLSCSSRQPQALLQRLGCSVMQLQEEKPGPKGTCRHSRGRAARTGKADPIPNFLPIVFYAACPGASPKEIIKSPWLNVKGRAIAWRQGQSQGHPPCSQCAGKPFNSGKQEALK